MLVCLALGVVSALETRHVSVAHGAPIAWPLVFASILPRWLLLAATLPVALRLATRPSFGSPRPRVVLAHVAVFGAISLAHAVVVAWTLALINPASVLFSWSARITRAFYNAMPVTVSMYGAVLAAAWALNEARAREERTVRASQLEAQLQAARLAALRARLQPHFLYNTLHAIAALVADSRRDQAVAAIEQLSDLLHASLRDDARDVIPIREEAELAERYLALQQMRFGDRLRYQLAIAPDVADARVPVLLLQPLVENAVLHGLDAGQARLNVTIAARRGARGIELLVENDGPAIESPARTNGHGVGLAATRARLETAYGSAASLNLEPRDGGGVSVRVTLPA